MSEDPSWMPNRDREGSAPAEAERERRRQLGSAGELSRSASPSVLPNNYPIVSLRQQLALIKQMEQPSPSGSTDGASVDGMAVGAATASGSLTPAGKKKIPKIHKKNDRGETPLHVAARKGDERQCVELLDAGAEVNCADYAGWTPLHEATAHGRWTTADMLLKRGANVNAASIDEETPLHDAAYNANAPLVWLLLSHGADKEKKNKKGERAMDICDEESRAYALLMLQSGELPAQCPDESPEGSPAPSSRKASPPHAAPVKVTEKPASLPPPPPAAAAALIDEPHLPPSVPISISVASPARWSTPPDTVPVVVVVPSPRQSPATRPSPRPSPRKTPSVSPREKEALPVARVPVETAVESAEREESPVPMRVEADIDTSPEMDPEAEPPMDDPTLSPTKEQTVEQVKEHKEGKEEEKETDRTLDATDPMIMQDAEVEKEEEKEDQDEPMEDEDDAPLEIDEGEEEADSPALQVAEEEEMEQDKPEQEEAEKDEDEESVEMGAQVVEQEKEKPAAAAAVWKQHVLLEKKAESVPPPDDSHAFDFAEEDDESKSARGRSEERTEPKRGRGRGRGRGRPAGHSSSGSATPQYGAAEKKKGRTRRRANWRAAGPTKDEQAAPTTASEDVYEFRSSPESEGEDGEPTGPSNKRIRLTAAATAAADTPSRAESNHSGELDGEEPDDVDDEDTKMSASTGPAKKVPPITLRLYGHQKTPSEDDGNDDAASNSLLAASYKESSAPPGMSSNGSVSGRRGGVGRGRFGKKSGGDGDDHARVTRSRVRQGGKQLDDDQQLPRKKGRRPAGDVASIGEMDEQEAEGSVPPEPREHRAPPTFEGETPAQQLLLVNSYAGVIGLKDLIERRWRATVESTPRSQTLPEKHAEYLVCTRDYPLRGECDEEDKPPQPPATVVPIMFDVWRKQEQKRVELRTKQRVARERARMMLEKERIRLERREINDAPAISAIQIIKEQSILNPLYLEEPQPRPPPLSRDAFSKKADEMKTDLFQRQKLDAGGLVAMQRSEWEWESRRRGVEFNKAILAQHIVPIDVVAISVEF